MAQWALMSCDHDRTSEEERFVSERNCALGKSGIYNRKQVSVAISIRLRPTARLNMSSTMLSHKSISTHGMTATSAWFLTPSSRSVTG